MTSINNPLRIENLCKRFGATLALDNINLTVEQGKVYGLLGPNGAGKTTLLRIINNLLTFDSGSVLVNGKPVSFKTSSSLGYMPEERGLYENKTVEEQIMFFGLLKGGEKKRLHEVMDEYMEIFNLKSDSKRKIKELSKGNQQKVQIVSTLVHEPNVVMLDEPFSGFDPINGQLLTNLIDRLKERGTTVILSSHNMPAVEEICSEIALVNHGKLILQGPIGQIKEENKGHEYLVTLENELSAPIIDRLSAEQIENQNSKGYKYLIHKPGKMKNSELIEYITSEGDILLFQEMFPSLNELFIKYAQ